MVSLTQKERESMLVLFKDFSSFYNANSMSKLLKMTSVGVQKMFKRLLDANLLISKRIGKSIIYKVNLNDNYVRQLMSFLLADEANNFRRWKEEFEGLFKKDRIVLMYGSSIKNYAQASDIDVMIILRKGEVEEVNKFIKEKKEILPKTLHSIKMTYRDLLENLKKKDKVMIDIIKNAIVLHGHDLYVEVIKNVTSI
ncbi:nucleotidyltransferase domain-containing protein [Candidatus Woesearchaeota archaeon]|nr:nucleotidyltransferase domain-containing protein [Candidatus Woesearchaeota archaeon]